MITFVPKRGHRRPRDAYDAIATTRLPSWKENLRAVIDDARNRRFKFGTFDCALFAAECVEAMTGVDYAESLRTYNTKAEAVNIIRNAGGFQQLITQQLGPSVSPHKAKFGDVVLAEIPIDDDSDIKSIGICIGPHCIFAGKDGIVFHPRTVAVRAWRIS